VTWDRILSVEWIAVCEGERVEVRDGMN
jgi:hypothetical protein